MPETPLHRRIAAALIVALLVVSVVLIYQRNGILAWLGLVFGIGLLAKLRLRPSSHDLPLSLTISTLWALSWAAIFFYVISIWETGEVVELTIETPTGPHSARTWIMEEPNSLLLYYDAPARVSNALASGSRLTIQRDGKPLAFKRYNAVRTDDMPKSDADRVLGLMSEKYGARYAAADLFYGFLGRAKNRVGVVIKIPRKQNRPGEKDQ